MKILTDFGFYANIIPEYKGIFGDIETMLQGMEHMLSGMDIPGEPLWHSLKRVVLSGGKWLRPILAYVCYRCGNRSAYPVLPLMCMLELMHTASIIHDDVVDCSAVRRGAATINAESGPVNAVRAGDYLLAEAMRHLHIYRGTGINEALAHASYGMCLGELNQLKARYDLTLQTREQYLIQIYRKTAGLIAASCFAGGIAGGLPEHDARTLSVYGEKLGMAFQICDDLLDFSGKQNFGKESGQDMKNGIFTLPVLYMLEKGAPDSVKELLVKRNKNADKIAYLIDAVNESAAIEYTKSVIRGVTDDAVEALRDFPSCVEKSVLTELASGLADRSR